MFEPQHHRKKKKNLCALIQLLGSHTIFKFPNLNGVGKDAWMEAPYIFFNLFICVYSCLFVHHAHTWLVKAKRKHQIP